MRDILIVRAARDLLSQILKPTEYALRVETITQIV
jgi:hypothetical protein